MISGLSMNLIRIGVTGHRSLAGVEILKESITRVLSRIEQDNPGQDWLVISALAEGADRLVVEGALAYKPTAKLIVSLPLPVEEYQKDFAGNASRQEFQHWLDLAVEVIGPPVAGVREEGYLSAGLYVLEHCDVLIALWDGLESQGLGGTGQIVALARERGMRLAWIYTNRLLHESTNEVYPGREAGTISFERFGD